MPGGFWCYLIFWWRTLKKTQKISLSFLSLCFSLAFKLPSWNPPPPPPPPPVVIGCVTIIEKRRRAVRATGRTRPLTKALIIELIELMMCVSILGTGGGQGGGGGGGRQGETTKCWSERTDKEGAVTFTSVTHTHTHTHTDVNKSRKNHNILKWPVTHSNRKSHAEALHFFNHFPLPHPHLPTDETIERFLFCSLFIC